jgi:lipid-A-disaccharide synthase
MKKILVSAIEISGDMHAANLIRQVKAQLPGVQLLGLGSTKLAAEGMQIIADVSMKSTIGILEPLKHIGGYVRLLKKLTLLMDTERPDLVLCIDGQGFHMPLAAEAKKRGIPVVYYIAPQEWLWGTIEGGKKVSAVCDLIISIFPEEHVFYKKIGAHSVYNGHPLVDIVKPTKTKKQFLANQVLPNKPIIALFPGSRVQEIKMLLPQMIAAIQPWLTSHTVIVVAANESCRTLIQCRARGVRIIVGDNYNAMAAADLVVTSTGTTTLECALIGTPLVAMYRLSRFSYWVVTKIAKIKLPRYKALPNMIAHKEIIPELIQEKCTVEQIQKTIEQTLKKSRLIRQKLKIFRKALYKKDILKKNAAALVKVLRLQ